MWVGGINEGDGGELINWLWVMVMVKRRSQKGQNSNL